MNLLVAETAEGLLNLSDAFLYESSTDLYSRVVAGEGVPAQPALYQVIPWDLEHSGDVLKFKDPKVVVGDSPCTSAARLPVVLVGRAMPGSGALV